MSACCGGRNTRQATSWQRRCLQMTSWAIPSAILAILPKCPLCLAAYAAVWTGVGLSLSTAIYLRWTLLVLCTASLLYLAKRHVRFPFGRRGRAMETAGK